MLIKFEEFWRDRKGSSFIEMAVLVPVVLLLCCGTMDFARVVHAGIEIAMPQGPASSSVL